MLKYFNTLLGAVASQLLRAVGIEALAGRLGLEGERLMNRRRNAKHESAAVRRGTLGRGESDPLRVTLSGRGGDDAKRYQEQEVAQRIAATRSTKGGGK